MPLPVDLSSACRIKTRRSGDTHCKLISALLIAAYCSTLHLLRKLVKIVYALTCNVTMPSAPSSRCHVVSSGDLAESVRHCPPVSRSDSRPQSFPHCPPHRPTSRPQHLALPNLDRRLTTAATATAVRSLHRPHRLHRPQCCRCSPDIPSLARQRWSALPSLHRY